MNGSDPMPTSHPYSRGMAEQLAFGAPFAPTSLDAQKAAALRAGTLDLPPNRTWNMPADITWYENPFKEPNWVAQFHMMRWIDPLRRQAEKGDTASLDLWLRIAEGWIEKNPPGRGRANYSWADMIEAGRAMTFAFALPVLEDHRPEKLPVILASLKQHGEWLADETHIRTGNHALQQHQGLLVIGAVLQRQEWVDLAVQRSETMLHESYDDQGLNEEGAVQYHQINFIWWNNLGRRVRIATGSTPEAFQRVSRAPLAMAHATRPDGRYELIGDTEEFTPRALGHPAIDYVSSAGTQGVAPLDRVAIFDSGYIYGRSTWGDERQRFKDASFYSLRFGPQNRIHGHADGMALTLWAGGESLLVDSGKYAYDAKDPYRAHLLSREAHNSLTITGAEYDRTTAVELIASSRHDNFEHYRFEDRGYSGVRLSREILISLRWKLAIVVDSFDADQDLDNDVTMSQWWHLSPEASHRKEDSSIVTRTPTNELRLAWPNSATSTRITRGTKNPIQGWFSPTWRKLEPVRTIEASVSGRSGRLVTGLSFSAAAHPLPLEITTDDEQDGLLIHLKRGDSAEFSALLQDSAALLTAGARTGPELALALR